VRFLRVVWFVLGVVAALRAQTTNWYSTRAPLSTTLPGYGQFLLARFDFNQDGRDDLLLGGENGYSSQKAPIVIMLNQGDGTFRDATSDYFEGTAPRAHHPICCVADLNNDGVPDFVIYDAGDNDVIILPAAYQGDVTQLYLSKPGRKWAPSTALRDMYASLGFPGVHCKQVAAADINRDGFIDLFVESGGGREPNPQPHFVLNNGNGTFTADLSYALISREQIYGPGPRIWRFGTECFADFDGDGWPDIVAGTWRNTNNGQDDARSRVCFNDRAGKFPAAQTVTFPLPKWNNGYTYTMMVRVFDFNGDGLPDVLLAHTKGGDAPTVVVPDSQTGLYFQVMLNRGNRQFDDATDRYFLDQSSHLASSIDPYGKMKSFPREIFFADMNGDGLKDLVMAGADSYMSDISPAIYFETPSGFFEPVNPRAVVGSTTFNGESLIPVDLNGDGKPDLVNPDLFAGPDGVYSTGDEFTKLVPIFNTANLPLPRFLLQPQSATVAPGGSIVLSANVTGTGALHPQWYRNGVPVPGATEPTLRIAPASATDAGEYRLRVTDDAAGSVSDAANVAVAASGATNRLSNLSVRTTLATAQTLSVGLTMSGGQKPVLLRAIGPGLAPFGFSTAVADPRFVLYDQNSVKLDENDDWSASLAPAFAQLGAFPLPPASRDAALVRAISGGSSLQINATGAGVVLVEAYDSAAGNLPRLTNLSVLGRVGTGEGLLVAGFTLDGTGGKPLLIRAVGPTLAAFGVGNALANPKLEVIRIADQQKIAENDDWSATLAPVATQAGAFQLNVASKDAALLIALPPGGYTVQVSGVGGTIGDSLIEIYEVP